MQGGSIGAVTYEAKKKGKICFVIYIAGKRFFFIYEVIVKQKIKKRSANHYSQALRLQTVQVLGRRGPGGEQAWRVPPPAACQGSARQPAQDKRGKHFSYSQRQLGQEHNNVEGAPTSP